jgi:exodeoxyribonuclease III
MRVVSWNINSVRARLPRLLSLLDRHKPDVVCLQETKVEDKGGFPIMQLDSAGYRSILHGQQSYNGVAILVQDPSRKGGLCSFGATCEKCSTKFTPTDIRRGFPGDPIPNEARVISACIGKLRIVNAYVVNGVSRESEQFKLKEKWMSSLGKWLHSLPSPMMIIGDFNVVPDERDVWDPVGLEGRIHCTDEERAWLRDLQGRRFQDLLRRTTQESGIYTWWPYQKDAFERNEGLRFDGVLGDEAVANLVKRVWVDKDERRPDDSKEKPSDHAPLIVDLDEP